MTSGLDSVSLWTRATSPPVGSTAHGITDLHYTILIVLSAIGSMTLLAVATVALKRRRSRPYLLLTGALAALVLRPLAATGLVLGIVPMEYHHLVEHFLDVCIAACLLGALYTVPSPNVDSLDDEPTTEYEPDD
jgi:hypothetical protein